MQYLLQTITPDYSCDTNTFSSALRVILVENFKNQWLRYVGQVHVLWHDFGDVSFLIFVLFGQAGPGLVENLIARTLSVMALLFVALFCLWIWRSYSTLINLRLSSFVKRTGGLCSDKLIIIWHFWKFHTCVIAETSKAPLIISTYFKIANSFLLPMSILCVHWLMYWINLFINENKREQIPH